MRKAFIITAAALMLPACAFFENTNPLSPSASFQKLDTNGDGVISRQEAKDLPGLARHFNRVDSSQDGSINPGEYQAATTFISRRPGLSAYDVNGNGVITRREANAARARGLRGVFDTVDTDGDGNIGPREFRAATTNLLQGTNFSNVDKDGDGSISMDEASKMPLLNEHFDRFDLNNDGQISKREFQDFQRHHRT